MKRLEVDARNTPNRLDRGTAERIIFGWTDTEQASERTGSKLIVIGDDRERELRDSSVQALTSYGIRVIPSRQARRS